MYVEGGLDFASSWPGRRRRLCALRVLLLISQLSLAWTAIHMASNAARGLRPARGLGGEGKTGAAGVCGVKPSGQPRGRLAKRRGSSSNLWQRQRPGPRHQASFWPACDDSQGHGSAQGAVRVGGKQRGGLESSRVAELRGERQEKKNGPAGQLVSWQCKQDAHTQGIAMKHAARAN